jgi:hypothetical protein
MAAPSWLAWTFAATMILTSGYSAGRLAVSRMRGRATELDADALHAVMGTAMAGMLVPRLHLVPDSAWTAVFGIGAAWFGWHTVHAQGRRPPSLSRCRYPVPHLVECAAMVYMLLSAHHLSPGRAGMAMPGMGASAGPPQSFPALAVVLALFMLGYILWTTDRLTSRAQPGATGAQPGRSRSHQAQVPVTAEARAPGAAPASGGPPAGTRPDAHVGRPALAPKLAACAKITMSITMGYMLVLML